MITNPAGLALYVRSPALASRLQAALGDVPVACASTPAELARLLGDPRWRAVAVEVAAAGEALEELVTRVATLFPDVPLVAIGARADRRALAPLLARGCVRRLLVRPCSDARLRAELAPLVGRPGARAVPARRAGAVAAGLLALATGALAAHGLRAPAPRAVPSPAPAHARPHAAPASPPPVAAVADVVAPPAGEALLGDAARAFDEGRQGEAAWRLAAAHTALGDDPRVADLGHRLSAARQRAAERRAAWALEAEAWSRQVAATEGAPR
jgi:hypothetical protein